MEEPVRALVAFGTRPEAVKMAPVVRALGADPAFDVRVLSTAQHREMLDQVTRLFGLRVDYDLDAMRGRQALPGLTARILEGASDVLGGAPPDVVLVHGDTTTTFAVPPRASMRGRHSSKASILRTVPSGNSTGSSYVAPSGSNSSGRAYHALSAATPSDASSKHHDFASCATERSGMPRRSWECRRFAPPLVVKATPMPHVAST